MRGDSPRGSGLTSRFRVSYRCAPEPRQPGRTRSGTAWQVGGGVSETGAGLSAPHLTAAALRRAADGLTCKGHLG